LRVSPRGTDTSGEDMHERHDAGKLTSILSANES
jgi:hypothetical protein